MSTYQGHHQDGSSVQKHSCGATYPYVLGYTERGGYDVLTPAGAWIDFGAYSKAYEAAMFYKAVDARIATFH